ncbi:hypothetical protein KA012_02275 [Candidatus Woesebacteria bacterium]|nr:hypothetical protein [Candidatus Woesebacteria bacterium]
MKWKIQPLLTVVVTSTFLVAFFILFIFSLPLREPSTSLSIGEYIAGNYPAGIAFYQPSSGHYYATSIYDDFIILDGVRQPVGLWLHTSSRRNNDTKFQSTVASLMNQWRLATDVKQRFDSPTHDQSIETIVSPMSSTSATLTRNWSFDDRQNISAAGITIKYSAQDLLIDQRNGLLYATSDRPIEQLLLEQTTAHKLTAVGELTEKGASWSINSNAIILINPDGAGVLRLKVIADQKIFINPANHTIEFVTNIPHSGQIKQQIVLETWPSLATYPWNAP